MEVTKKYIAGLIGVIRTEYPKEFANAKENDIFLKIELWNRSLGKYPKEIVDVAFQKAIESSNFPPKLSDIITNINKIKQSTEKTDTELWEELLNALQKVNEVTYFGAREFFLDGKIVNAKIEVRKIYKELNPLLKNYVGGAETLVDLAKQPTLEYEKGRFLKILPSLKEREEIKKEVSAEVLQLFDKTLKTIDCKNEQKQLTKVG